MPYQNTMQFNFNEISEDSNFVGPPGKLKSFSMKVKSENGRERTESMKLTDKAESIERVRRRFVKIRFSFFYIESFE